VAKSPRTKSDAERTARSARAERTQALRSRLSPEEVERFFEALARSQPPPAPELVYRNPFTLLVAVVLSAQATDRGVNRVTAELFKKVSRPEDILALGEEGLVHHIRSLGLYRNKARNLVALARILVERFGGEVPRTRSELESLPGVGRKTANVVLNTAFGEPTIAVDTHVFRVANRTGLAPGRTPAEVEAELERVVPERFKHGAHHWLIRHGRYVCKARRPECWRCPVADICRYPEKILTPDRSVPSGRRASARRRSAAAHSGTSGRKGAGP